MNNGCKILNKILTNWTKQYIKKSYTMLTTENPYSIDARTI